jgi:hypothetical protein
MRLAQFIGGRACGKTEIVRQLIAYELKQQEEQRMKRPGAKFEHWYIVHNIPDLVMRYSR